MWLRRGERRLRWVFCRREVLTILGAWGVMACELLCLHIQGKRRAYLSRTPCLHPLSLIAVAALEF